MDPLKVNTIGAKGVNTVDSPIHVEDDDILAGQNAEIYFEDGYPGIRKRLGIAALSTAALDGPIFGFTSIPLPDPFSPPENFTIGLFAWHTTNVGGEAKDQVSADGVTWIDGPNTLAVDSAGANHLPAFITLAGVIYFTSALAHGTIRTWDGSVETFFQAPATVTLAGDPTWALNGFLFNLTTDGIYLYAHNTYSRSSFVADVFFKIDPIAQTFTKVGEAFCTSGMASDRILEDNVQSMVWWNSRLWIINSFGVTFQAVKVRSIDPLTETTWTLDHSFGGLGNSSSYGSVQLLGGANYLALAANPNITGGGGTKAILKLRTIGAVWSTLEQSPTTNGDFYSIIYNFDRFIVHRAVASTDAKIFASTDFSTFSEIYDYNEVAFFRHSPALLFQSNLYTILDRAGGALTVTRISGTSVQEVLQFARIPTGLGAR